VAVLIAEVIINYLHDAGLAVAADHRTHPHAAHSLGVPDRRASRGSATHDQPSDSEQDKVKASTGPRLRPGPGDS
jgi:hypothetical protein